MQLMTALVLSGCFVEHIPFLNDSIIPELFSQLNSRIELQLPNSCLQLVLVSATMNVHEM
jgi:hypothetical protein